MGVREGAEGPHGVCGAPGMIDPERRAGRGGWYYGRTMVQGVAEELWEIYATNPLAADEELAEVVIERP